MNSVLTQHRALVDVVFVAVIGGIFVTLIVVALRQAFRTPGRPKGYVGEHAGAQPGWSPLHEIRNAPPAPAVPTKVLLEEAEAEYVKAHDKVARLRQRLADEEDERYVKELREIHKTFTGQLPKIGQLELHTVEVSRDVLRTARQ